MASTARATVFLVLVGSVPVGAQSLTRSVVSRDFWPDLQAYDAHLLSVEDQNGDGIAEVLIGDWSYRDSGVNLSRGKVTLLDGATGEEIFGILGEQGPYGTYDRLGLGLALVGDVNRDGIRDVLAGCLFGPARILSGRDGSELFRTSYNAEEVVALGDLDHDGMPEFGLRRTVSPWGVIDVHSGETLEKLYSVQPPFLSYLFGYSAVSIGDVDGDRVPDFAVSAPDNTWHPIRDYCYDTYVFVYSGKDGQLLYHIPRPGVDECEAFGYSLAGPGDLNGDGHGDLVVGLPDAGGVATSFPRVFFHDGKSGARFGEVGPPPGRHAHFARVLVLAGDCNGNGFPDLLVSNALLDRFSINNRGEAWVLDGGTHELLYRIRGDPTVGPSLPQNFGQAMTGLGDVDGDDFPDFLIGTLGLNVYLGRLDWFSGAPQGVRSRGEPCSSIPGVTPRIGASGVPRIGDTYEIHLSRVAPAQKAFLAVGFPTAMGRAGRGQGLALPSARLGCGGGTSVPAKLFLASAEATVQGNAAATVGIPLPNDPALVGQVLLAQWFLVGSSGSAATRVLEITIQDSGPARD